jgi:hypothetical protein
VLIKARLLYRLFLKRKIFKLGLIGLNVWIISLLFILSIFLLTVLNDHLLVRYLGAVPSVTVAFEKPVAPEEMQRLIRQIDASMETDAARVGYQITKPASIRWIKGDQAVATQFEMVLIGLDLQYSIDLLVSDGIQTKHVACLKMHPAYGFYVPEDQLHGLGKEIVIQKATVRNFKTYDVPMNIEVKQYLKTEDLNGIECRRLVLPLPQKMLSEKEEEKLQHREKLFYAKISGCLSCMLGDRLQRTMNGDLRQSLFNLFNGDNMCIPSLQIWEDMCGTGVVDRASFKEIEFSITDSGQPFDLNTHGFLRTRYNAAENGYRTYLEIGQLRKLLGGARIDGRNLLELDIPDCFPGSRNYMKLQEVVKADARTAGARMIPWWERVDTRTVNLILHSMKHARGITLIILFFSFIGLYHMCLRFSREIRDEWTFTATFFGGRKSMLAMGLAVYCLIILVFDGVALGAVIYLGKLFAPAIMSEYAGVLPHLYMLALFGVTVGTLAMMLFTIAESFGSREGILVIIVVVVGACCASLLSSAYQFQFLRLAFIPLALFIITDGFVHLFYRTSGPRSTKG